MGRVEKETRNYFTIDIEPALQANQTVSFLTISQKKQQSLT